MTTDDSSEETLGELDTEAIEMIDNFLEAKKLFKVHKDIYERRLADLHKQEKKLIELLESKQPSSKCFRHDSEQEEGKLSIFLVMLPEPNPDDDNLSLYISRNIFKHAQNPLLKRLITDIKRIKEEKGIE